MRIEEVKAFLRENVDKVLVHRNMNWNNRETLVRVVGWSIAFKGVYIIVSVDTRNRKPYTPTFDYSHINPKKDFLLSKRPLEDKQFWYISKKEYLTPYKE